jgi:hyperpolarization activated cyclic nucleotide-gated potassium channel 2
MLVIVTIDCVLLPIELGFVDEFALSPGWFWFTTVYFCTDLVLNFFTAYFKDKQLVTQLHRIAWHYLTTWFLVDFVSSVPWVVIIPLFFGGGADTAQSMRVARITKLAKLARCLRLMRMPGVINMDVIKCRIENWIGPALTTHLLQLLKFFLLLIYFCHWNACIWWLIGQPAYDEVDGVEMHWTKVVHTKFIYGEQGELVRCVCASAPPPFGRQVARTGRGQRRF